MLGSVAREIVQASNNPVLVFRPDGKSHGLDPIRITTVLLPLDGSSLSESVETQAATLAVALGAGLTMVQVLPANTRMDPLLTNYDILDSSYVSARARDLAREFGVRVDWEVPYGDPVDSIARFLNGRRDVLAVMATRKQNALKAAVLGSVTSGMVHKAGIPIIVQAPGKTAGASPKFPGFPRNGAQPSRAHHGVHPASGDVLAHDPGKKVRDDIE
jgi:nucleotide-binding universal stress UspA family protein